MKNYIIFLAFLNMLNFFSFGWWVDAAEYPWSSVHDLDIDMKQVKLFCQEVNCSKDRPFPSITIISNVSNYEYTSQFDKRVNIKIYKRSIVFITYSWKKLCFSEPRTALDRFPLREIIRMYKNDASYFEYYFNDPVPIIVLYDPAYEKLKCKWEPAQYGKGIEVCRGNADDFERLFSDKIDILFIYDQGIGKLKRKLRKYIEELVICNTLKKRNPINCTIEHFGRPRCAEEDAPLNRMEWQTIIKKELNLLKDKKIFRNIDIINIDAIARKSQIGHIVMYKPALFSQGKWVMRDPTCCSLHENYYYINPALPEFFEAFRGYFPELEEVKLSLLIDLGIIVILSVLLVFFIKRWMNEQKLKVTKRN
jgi:hypothetical protein